MNRSLWTPLICIAFVVIMLECPIRCEEPIEASSVQITDNEKVLDSSKAHEPPTDTKISLSAIAEFEEYDPSRATNCWVDINLSAPLYPRGRGERKGVDIVAVIDRSGSMTGEKLSLVKKTLLFVVTQLTEKDRIGLVVYDDTMDIVFHLTPTTADNRNEIETRIKEVFLGGRTNLCGGLLEGMRMISSRTGEVADVASVLLLTDGLANVGISDTSGILQAMKNPGIMEPEGATQGFRGTVYTFGFGGDHDAEMLKEISEAGNGVYYFIDSNDKIPESFTDCLSGLLSTVGQNLSLKVELSNGATISEFVAKKSATFNADRTTAEVKLGDIQSEEQRDIVMEIQLPECPLATCGVVSYATLTLSYHNVLSNTSEEVVAILLVERADTGKPLVTHRLIGRQRNRILTMRALEAAQRKAEEGMFEESRQLLEDTKSQLLSSDTSNEQTVLGMLDDLADLCVGVADSDTYNHYGKMRAVGALQSHREQRSNYAAPEGRVRSYETKSKSEMKGGKGA